jgi:hypothetical protein
MTPRLLQTWMGSGRPAESWGVVVGVVAVVGAAGGVAVVVGAGVVAALEELELELEVRGLPCACQQR